MFGELPEHVKEQIFKLVDNEKRGKEFAPSLVSRGWHDSIMNVSSGRLVKHYLNEGFYQDTSLLESHARGEKFVIACLAALGLVHYKDASDPKQVFIAAFMMVMLSALCASVVRSANSLLRPHEERYNFFKNVANCVSSEDKVYFTKN